LAREKGPVIPAPRSYPWSAQDHKAGRTNQSAAGAYRLSVIVSVPDSLRVNLDTFTLASVIYIATLHLLA